MSRMPTLFIPHGGGPCFFMESDPIDMWDNMEAYLRGFMTDLEEKPKAILIISGHWEEDEVTVQSNPAPGMLFDYHGFPPHTYELKFPAKGSPELVGRVSDLLNENDIANTNDANRGFDHGVFIPLLVAMPDADIPVVQLSLRADMDAGKHIEIGKALEPLRDEGVLILGSGMSYHNLQIMISTMRNQKNTDATFPEALSFDSWLTQAVTDSDPATRNEKLCDWAKAPAARAAHPREEHLLPLHVVAGAAGDDIGKTAFNDMILGIPQSAFKFG
ncbi:MAG: dioxygenase [Hyphomicrobiales bacterium]|nr:MAG: dioxygenase [Hyphomicrobiales bacterium]